jgi:hypothetical protein
MNEKLIKFTISQQMNNKKTYLRKNPLKSLKLEKTTFYKSFYVVGISGIKCEFAVFMHNPKQDPDPDPK